MIDASSMTRDQLMAGIAQIQAALVQGKAQREADQLAMAAQLREQIAELQKLQLAKSFDTGLCSTGAVRAAYPNGAPEYAQFTAHDGETGALERALQAARDLQTTLLYCLRADIAKLEKPVADDVALSHNLHALQNELARIDADEAAEDAKLLRVLSRNRHALQNELARIEADEADEDAKLLRRLGRLGVVESTS